MWRADCMHCSMATVYEELEHSHIFSLHVDPGTLGIKGQHYIQIKMIKYKLFKPVAFIFTMNTKKTPLKLIQFKLT